MKGHQRGQAMPLGIALILFSVLGALVVYNTGQSVSQKARLVNAADAAAYSGLQWQARALNFTGYTNRAMVANQVSLAQAVSLSSWATYGMIMAENLEKVLSAIPVVNAIASGVSVVMNTIEAIVTPVAGAMLQVIDKVNAGVSIAQEAMYTTSYLATPEIVKAVATQTDPEFNVETAYTVAGVLRNLNEWESFSEKVSDEREDYDKVRERAQIIRDSQDAFSRARDWSFFNGYLYVLPFLKVDLKKEGETRLIEREGSDGLEWEWKAKDSMSFHTKVRVPFRGWKGVEIPVGYGMAVANDVGDVSIEEGACTSRRDWRNCATWSRHNETSESLADRNYVSLGGSESRVEMSGFSELNTFRRLSEESIGKAFPTLKLRVEVEAPASSVASSNALVAGEQFTTPTAMPGDAMSSVSIAEVYFKPPEADHASRQGKHIEFANLYSPWWDVRLAPVPETERLAALTLRAGSDGLSVLPGMVPLGTAEGGQDEQAQGQPGGSTEGGGQSSSANAEDGQSAQASQALATAAGLSNASSTQARVDVISSQAGDLGQNLLESVRGTFGDAVSDTANAAGDKITEHLNSVLEDAVQDILNGVVSSASGGLVTADDVKDWANEVRSETDDEQGQVTSAIATARQEMDELQDEFERLDAVVTERFEGVFDEHRAAYASGTAGLRSTLSGYIGREVGLFERVSTGLLSDNQRDTAQELDRHRSTLIADLSVAYRDIVNEETDRFEMSYAMARDFVTTALATYDSLGGDINWAFFELDPPDETLATPADGEPEEEEDEESQRTNDDE